MATKRIEPATDAVTVDMVPAAFDALQAVLAALRPLNTEQRERVVRAAAIFYEVPLACAERDHG